MQDIRVAFRSLARSPGFAVAVVASLGVGIGAATTAYHWIDAFVLHPLPAVTRSDRLVSVYTQGPGGAEWSVSYPRFQRWREAAADRAELVLHRPEQLSLREGSESAERLWGDLVSGNFFDVVGVRAFAGRTLTMADERSAAPVVVLSERYWERRFDRDLGVVGRQVLINGQGFTVVGIVPARFAGMTVGFALEAWIPITTTPVLFPGNTSLTDDDWQWLEVAARPAEGASFAQTRAWMDDVSRKVSQSLGESTPVLAGVRTLSDAGAGRFVGPLFYTLFGLAAVILLIACANVANLLLVRGSRRAKEVALRLALGADRWRIIRQLLAESLLLALGGGALGLLLAVWGKGLLSAVLPSLPFPVNLTSALSYRVAGAAIVMTALTAVLFGLAPAIRASRPGLTSAIRDERHPGSGRTRLQSALVVTQVALSLTALVTAGLFLRSLDRARNADPGFSNAATVLAVNTDFRLAGLADTAAQIQLDQVLERVRAIPGVVRAATTSDLPVSLGGHSSSGVEPEGYEPNADENMSIEYTRVSAGYFETMGIQARQGRLLLATDGAESDPVLVINEAFAARFFPSRDPVGARIRAAGKRWTVVGVVGNVVLERFGENPVPYLYYPVAQRFGSDLVLVVQGAVPPARLVEPVRTALRAVNPDLPVLDPRTMVENMSGAMFVQSTGAALLGGLGVVALALAALGLYGVLAYSVSQRTREIGIRMALGSMASGIVRLVVRQAAGLIAIGVVVGTGLALGVASLIRSQLFGIQSTDPVTFGAVLLLLVGVGFAAAAIPARRAASVDPVTTLKVD